MVGKKGNRIKEDATLADPERGEGVGRCEGGGGECTSKQLERVG